MQNETDGARIARLYNSKPTGGYDPWAVKQPPKTEPKPKMPSEPPEGLSPGARAAWWERKSQEIAGATQYDPWAKNK